MNRYSLSLDAREGKNGRGEKNGRGDPYMKNMFWFQTNGDPYFFFFVDASLVLFRKWINPQQKKRNSIKTKKRGWREKEKLSEVNQSKMEKSD